MSNYVFRKLDEEINLISENREKMVYYQNYIEFGLIFILSYLFNKNINRIEDKSSIFEKLLRPSIGTYFEIIRMLDLEKEVINDKNFNLINEYPRIRNEYWGHGYLYNDQVDKFLQDIIKLKDSLISIRFLTYDFEFVQIVAKDNNNKVIGINYNSNGQRIRYISQSELNINNLYCMTVNNGVCELYRISPFILVSQDQWFLYRNVSDKCIGRIEYNKIFYTGKCFKDWDDVYGWYNVDLGKGKIRSANNIIYNEFQKNYDKYIDIGLKENVKDFVIKNTSNVLGIITGHGGVGKTALVQSLIDDLIQSQGKKYFDYIVFLSAKRENYSIQTGHVSKIEPDIHNFEELINRLYDFVFGNNDITIEEKIKFLKEQQELKILLVIDDLETLKKEDIDKIKRFVFGLNIANYKVLVTTRYKLSEGIQIEISELDENATFEFFKKIISDFKCNLRENELKKKIYKITSGNPLFIFQLAKLHNQIGDKAFNQDLSIGDNAIKFLYDRLIECLSEEALTIFKISHLLVSDMDLSGYVSQLKYMVDLKEKFDNALGELINYRLLYVDIYKKVYYFYNESVLKLSKKYFENENKEIKEKYEKIKDKVYSDKGEDPETIVLRRLRMAFLNSNYSYENIVENYEKEVFQNERISLKNKLKALIHCFNYFFIDLDEKDNALKIIDKYENIFKADIQIYTDFIKFKSQNLWGEEKYKEKVIEVLKNYVIKYKNKFRNNVGCVYIESLYLMYSSIYLINKWKIAKSENNTKILKQIRRNFKELNQYGINIFNNLKNVNNTYEDSLKRIMVEALFKFLQILLRLDEKSYITEICVYVSNNLNDKRFASFMKWVNSLENNESKIKTKKDLNNIDKKTFNEYFKDININKIRPISEDKKIGDEEK